MTVSLSSSPQRLPSWDLAKLPILNGDAPVGTVTLHALADVEVLAGLVPLIAAHTSSDYRQAAITLLHYAVRVITDTLLSALTLDGVTIEATAADLGVVFGEKATLNASWVSPNITIREGAAVTQLGGQTITLLNPIVAAVQTYQQLSRRGLDLVLFDAIRRGCRRLSNSAGTRIRVEHGWQDALLSAMGDSTRKPMRTVTVQPDNGEPIPMVIPRVCCVLAQHPSAHACPTCPQHSEADRRQYTESWLRALGDDSFRVETGRARLLSDNGHAK